MRLVSIRACQVKFYEKLKKYAIIFFDFFRENVERLTKRVTPIDDNTYIRD